MDKVCKCSKCPQWLNKKTAVYSKDKYGEELCWNHQREEDFKNIEKEKYVA